MEIIDNEYEQIEEQYVPWWQSPYFKGVITLLCLILFIVLFIYCIITFDTPL